MEGKIRIEEHSLAPLQHYDSASEDEYVSILIERETGTLAFKNIESFIFVNCFSHSRMNALNWILQTRATLGFSFQTAYLSMAYFDRFLSKCSIDSGKCWKMRLLSIACLTLAAKMEESEVPVLTEFQSEDYCFENKVIQRMELLVLSTLEWNMVMITPLVFLPYFITKLCNESQTCHVLSKTIQIIFTLIQEVNLMDHRPSVIAAAATLVAMDQHLTVESVKLKMSSIHEFRFLVAEDIFAYYDQIQSFYIEKENYKTQEKESYTQ
ncbi:cyclin-D5-1-like [Arachis duranensis]|uniref:B-like cyclin n=1 Tax=Arachis duranensis TaxID=130453 RepID=A0A6P4DQN7_ARADU|nr:cyclin-D5-1-like [Arachis duranensis]